MKLKLGQGSTNSEMSEWMWKDYTDANERKVDWMLQEHANDYVCRVSDLWNWSQKWLFLPFQNMLCSFINISWNWRLLCHWVSKQEPIIQILYLRTLSIVLFSSKTPSCFYFKTQYSWNWIPSSPLGKINSSPESGTSSIDLAQLNRFHLKTETESSL
jgi:hypothetical protein